MIEVQVRTENGVDVLARKARVRQPVGKIEHLRGQHFEARDRLFAHARVDDDELTARLDEKGVNRQGEVACLVEEVGAEPLDVGL